jgi:alanyl-tRNA synthetase
MTSAQIRQSFLGFFKSKQHTIVPSSSLMPDAPNLLFTNAGMNQFVPIFLAQRAADVSKWPGAVPGLDTRAADTQKCIRAGGKHNDLEDVGLDTYHHTFFEMLGNWSFGDYFKKEAIEWAWELVTEVWKFPKERLYATVYQPGEGDPAEFDQEAYDHWARLFSAAGLDPKVHICTGGKKDNFWMMGDTGPCGPCSEIHVDLTPAGDTKGSLVNKGDARCIEIWNLVFIQFNAQGGTAPAPGAANRALAVGSEAPTSPRDSNVSRADAAGESAGNEAPGRRAPQIEYVPLSARHVDTGMGFERVTSIIQCTRGFTDFNRRISNYETDIFRPLFDQLESLSGKRYGSTLPSDAPSEISNLKSQIAVDVAFRVIADHIRTLSFAIADGIQPGNTDRNYVLRRILRRAVRYGRTLGFHEPFFYRLVDVVADTMGDVFPEVRAKKKHVQEVIRVEEAAFNKTLDRGIELFTGVLERQQMWVEYAVQLEKRIAKEGTNRIGRAKLFANLTRSPATPFEADPCLRFFSNDFVDCLQTFERSDDFGRILATVAALKKEAARISGRAAFVLYDTYGFPLDLTELMARERGLTVDVEGFNRLMDEQRARARAAQKKQVIEISQVETRTPTRFVGYDQLETTANVIEVVSVKDRTAVILDTSACYAEMGGQVGDTGELSHGGQLWRIVNTQKSGNTWLHILAAEISNSESQISDAPEVGSTVTLTVHRPRRDAIQRHHTVTHLFHWALHEVVSPDARQQGSYVGPEKLTFDFNSAPLTPQQLADIEKLVNERIVENAGVSWTEVFYSEVRPRKDVLQFFGEKYGDLVRVVQIGGKPGALDGYSMELCGGTHTRATGEIGLFRIVSENAIASGIRRIEAIAGLTAYEAIRLDRELIRAISGKVNSPIGELEKKIESLLEQQKALEKQLKAVQQKEAATTARSLLSKAVEIPAANAGSPLRAIIENVGEADGDTLQSMVNELKGQFKGVIVLGGTANNAVALIAAVSPEFTSRVQAGKLIQQIAPIVGGKGGGKPDNARGGGKDIARLDEALTKARTLLV